MADFRELVREAVRIVGSQARLAAELGISQPSVHGLCTDVQELRAELAVAIERATDGKIPRWKLRPDLWSQPLSSPTPTGEAA